MADIVDTAAGSGEFDILVSALDAAGLTSTLRDASGITVFAPTDAAFAALAARLGHAGDPADEMAVFDFLVGALEQAGGGDAVTPLTEILLYHVGPEALTAAGALAAPAIGTLLGGAAISPSGGRLGDLEPDLPDPGIVTPDIAASNGTIHGLDAVLMPLDLVSGPIRGTAGPDALPGTPGADAIEGLAGDDTLTGAAGDDTLDGGTGTDTAAYSGARAAHTVTLSPDGIAVEDRRAGGDGTDALTSIEALSFADGDWPLALFAGATGVTEQDLRALVEVYVAFFDRAPDAEGLFFWAGQLAAGQGLDQIAELFFASEEARSVYPGLDPEAPDAGQVSLYVRTVYENVLGRRADGPGLDFWVGEIASGAVPPGAFIPAFLAGARAPAAPGTDPAGKEADRAHLETKTELGLYFAVTLGMNDADDGREAMMLFDGSAASAALARDAIDAAYAAALDPASGGFLLPLVGVVDDPFALT